MTTIVTRAGKGSPLTNNEVDANFVNLNDAKIETLTSTDSSVTITGTGDSRDLSVDLAGAGDVDGPASATDNAVSRYDGTTGKLIQNSVVTVDDTGVVAGASISGTDNTLSNIGNAALTNSSISVNGTPISLGGSVSVGTVTSVAATAGTGISITGSPITGSGTLDITNTAPDQVVALTGAGTTSVTGTYPNFTITSSDAYTGTVTNVTGTAPIAVANGTTTPAVSISQANTTTDGYLSSTDWNTFNSKYDLPSQTGNDGKVLTTDGSTATWQAVNADPVGTAVAMAIALG